MNVTDVRVRLVEPPEGMLLAYARVVLDGALMVWDLRLIAAHDGSRFLGMPDRHVTDRCPACGGKNALAHRYCCQCGSCLPAGRVYKAPQGLGGRPRLRVDLIHPLHQDLRSALTAAVIQEYEEELARSRQPAFLPRWDERRLYGGRPAEGA